MKDTAILIPLAVFASTLKVLAHGVFADGTPNVDPGLGSLIGNVGVLGILVWYLWYNTAVAQPNQINKFTAEQTALRESSEKAQDALRLAFASEQKELRATFAAEQASLREAFATENRLIREHTASESSELRAILAQALGAMRTAVHDVKDTANQAILKTDLSIARAEQERKQGS